MDKYTISQIRELLLEDKVSDEFLIKIESDSRKGVRKLIDNYYSRLKKEALLLEEHNKRLSFENNLLKNPDINYIAGIDEVGRGPLAGPVVAASVILPKNTEAFIGISDSKTLSKKQREKFSEIIKEKAVAYSIIEIDKILIDKHNILEATKIAMIKSVNNLPIKPQHLLIDALKLKVDIEQTAIIEGDLKSLSIAAASIIAKVHRDKLMEDYGKLYPEYGFERNMGYGTKEHLQALDVYGYTPIHRHSFAPVQRATKKYGQ